MSAFPAITREPVTWYRGDTLEDVYFITEETTGDAVDLTGATFRAQVRSSANEVLASFDSEVDPATIAVDATAGKITLRQSAATTAGWGWEHGTLDIEQRGPGTDIDGELKVRTLTKLPVVLVRDVTRAS